MAVVVLLFIAVLKQFGILEPMSMEGNARSPAPPLPCAGGQRSEGREQHLRSGVRVLGSGEERPSGTLRSAALPASAAAPSRLRRAGLGLRGQRGLGLRRVPEGMEPRRLGWV